jgi:Concanavalin A-like lectin/glucanases superfamily/Carboxypeptidase regulatory-like domain
MQAAAECQGRVEVLAARDEKTQVFANANGSFTAETSAVVQRVRAAGGRWVKPDPTLRRDLTGRIAPAATSMQVSFSGGGAGAAVTIGKAKATLGLHWPTPLPRPELSGANATYREVLPGVDLVLTAQPEGFAETLVVKTAAAAANPDLATVRFRTSTRGLRLRQGRSGALTAVDGAGATLFGSGTPMMWDAAKPAGEGQHRPSRLAVPGKRRTAMPLELSGSDLIVHPDLAMLRDKATTFPVYIDPAISKSAWTMINSTFPSQSYWSYDKQDCPSPFASVQCAKVGYTNQPKAMVYRSLFAFGISGLLRKHIQDAKLSMDTVYSYTNTDYGTQVRVAGAINSGTDWSSNEKSWGAVVATAKSHAHDRVRRRTEWGVTSAVRTAAGGTATTLTLGLRAVSESNLNHWKKFDAGTAKLTVTYNSYPNAPDAFTVAGQPCVRGATRPYVRTLTPALKARLSDPDGTVRLLKGTFYWWNLSGGTRVSTQAAAQSSIVSGQYANTAVPSGKLADGGTYVVQAIANDGIDSGQYSATCEFQVDVTAPAAPSAVTSADYPSDGQLHGGVGTAGSFVLKPPSTVPADFYGYAYTLDPGVAAAAATQVTADSTDRTATVSITPKSDQAFNLRVWARDKAGNYSAPVVYPFSVRAGTGPDARWTFDDSTGADDSAHGNTVAVTSPSWAAGRGGFGTAFVGNGTTAFAATTGPVATKDRNTGSAIMVHSNQSFTVAATVRLDSTAGSGQRVVVAQDGSRTSPFLLSYSVADKKWRFAVAATDVDAPATAAVLSNAVASTGVWTRLVATYDGAGRALKLYVNGVLQTATASSTTFDATGPVTIGRGRAAGAASGYFPGAIDDVRLYGRAIGDTEQEFTLVGLPNPPLVSFPDGTSGYVGRPLQVVISVGGDTSVTKVRYQLGESAPPTTVKLPSAGGQVTVSQTSSDVMKSLLSVWSVDASDGLSAATSTALEFAQAPALTGQVTDAATGKPLAGIAVLLTPGELTQTTDSAGHYEFTGIAPGSYSVVAGDGGKGCAQQTATSELTITEAVGLDLQLEPQKDMFGYQCHAAPNTSFIPGVTKLAFSESQYVSDAVPLPFSMPYYGHLFDEAYISPSGVLAFVDTNGYIPSSAVSLPDTLNAPLGSLMPFWDDLVIDSAASIWTATIGSGQDRRFVVEWRNMRIRDAAANAGERMTFEVVLAPNGGIAFNYAGLTSDRTKGSEAAVGMTSPGGGYGLQYSFGAADLASGTAVVMAYPTEPKPIPVGSITGTVTVDGKPAPNVGLMLGWKLPTWTDEDGRYSFSDLDSGVTYIIESSPVGCDGLPQREVLVDGPTMLDLPLGGRVDPDGYHCELEESKWLSGSVSTPENWFDLPFEFPLYGVRYSSLHTDTSGLQLGNDGRVAMEIDDKLVGFDSDTVVSTSVVGVAPHRQFVWEVLGAPLDNSSDVRVTYEIQLGEDGIVKFLFKDADRLGEVELKASVFENDVSFYYREDGRGLDAGKAVVLYPPVGS